VPEVRPGPLLNPSSVARNPRPCHNPLNPKGPVLENTFSISVCNPQRNAGFCHVHIRRWRVCVHPTITDGMGLSVRLAACLIACFQHPVHPSCLKTGRVVFSRLDQEQKFMTDSSISLASHSAKYATTTLCHLGPSQRHTGIAMLAAHAFRHGGAA